MNCPTCERPYGVRRRCYFCGWMARRTGEVRTCTECGVEFYIPVRRAQVGVARQCSYACAGVARRVDVAVRFWSHVDKSGDCWVWTGALYPTGYGHFTPDAVSERKGTGAHRVSWSLANGPIPGGLLVCHTCDNRPCVRPDHLFLGTQSDNRNDMYAKGRGKRAKVPPQ